MEVARTNCGRLDLKVYVKNTRKSAPLLCRYYLEDKNFSEPFLLNIKKNRNEMKLYEINQGKA